MLASLSSSSLSSSCSLYVSLAVCFVSGESLRLKFDITGMTGLGLIAPWVVSGSSSSSLSSLVSLVFEGSKKR